MVVYHGHCAHARDIIEVVRRGGKKHVYVC